MKILITGALGQLGNEFKQIADKSVHDFFFTDVQELDLTKKEAVGIFIKDLKPDYVVNCAAYTAVDKAESESELAHLINVEAVANLSETCSQHDITLFHISTDFVFDGDLSRPLSEGDVEKPLSVYGKTKLEGEKKALENPKTIVLRTSWLYSCYGNNFVKTMIRLGEERTSLNVIFDQIGTPTWANDLANAIMSIVNSTDPTYGVYHFSNEGVASWYDFALAIFEIKGMDIIVSPIKTEEYPTPATRPLYSVLDKSKIKKDYHLSIPYWRDSLRKMLQKL